MKSLTHRTKIVATIGPASSSPEMLKPMLQAGINLARLNFSHARYQEHARMFSLLRSVSQELDLPIILIQDLQGATIRVGQLPKGEVTLTVGAKLTLVTLAEFDGQADTVPIDYPYLAEEAQPGAQVLLDGGLWELKIETVKERAAICTVVEGGVLKSRKVINLPSLNLRLPSMSEQDQKDLEFGLSQDIDLVSLSWVRQAADIRLSVGLSRC